MPKKLLAYGGGLIALYLVVVHASGSGTVLYRGASGVSTVVKTFQGR